MRSNDAFGVAATIVPPEGRTRSTSARGKWLPGTGRVALTRQAALDEGSRVRRRTCIAGCGALIFSGTWPHFVQAISASPGGNGGSCPRLPAAAAGGAVGGQPWAVARLFTPSSDDEYAPPTLRLQARRLAGLAKLPWIGPAWRRLLVPPAAQLLDPAAAPRAGRSSGNRSGFSPGWRSCTPAGGADRPAGMGPSARAAAPPICWTVSGRARAVHQPCRAPRGGRPGMAAGWRSGFHVEMAR